MNELDFVNDLINQGFKFEYILFSIKKLKQGRPKNQIIKKLSKKGQSEQQSWVLIDKILKIGLDNFPSFETSKNAKWKSFGTFSVFLFSAISIVLAINDFQNKSFASALLHGVMGAIVPFYYELRAKYYF